METSLRPCGEDDSTDLYTGEQGERLVIHVAGSDNSGTDTPEEGSSTDTASDTETFHWLDCIV